MKRDREYDYDNEEEEVREEPSIITDWELMRLNDCATSTRMGMADQGFPTVMKRLAALRFVTEVGKGYQITNEGQLYLKKHLLKKRSRK